MSICCEAHWVRRRLLVVAVEVWNRVAILHLLVEFIVAVGEAGGLFDCIPFLGALTVTVRPPLGTRVDLGMAGSIDLRSSRESIRVRRWLGISVIDIRDKVTLQIDLLVEGIFAVHESGSLFNTVPLLRALTIAVRPPLSETLLITIRNLSSGSEAIWMRSRLRV